MLRLFLVRLIKKKSPFKGDLNHLHHIVNSYIRNDNLTIICTLFLSALPSLMLLFELKTYYIFVINIIIYSLVITYLKKIYNKMEALVTGGAGYIGSTVSNFLIDLGHEVTIIDNLSTGNKNIPKRATFYKLDISDTKKI